MLAAVGRSIDELFEQIPASVRLGRPLGPRRGEREMELVADLRGLAGRDRAPRTSSASRAAAPTDHFVPSIVWALAGRSEFYTSSRRTSRSCRRCVAGSVRVPVDDLRAHRQV